MTKKVFLSLPMRNRTQENIKKSIEKMKVYIKTALGEDTEFIDNFVTDKNPETANSSVWYLGEAIKKLSEANVLVTVDCPYYLQANGVNTERNVFYNYSLGRVIELPIELVIDADELFELRKQYDGDKVPLGCDTCCGDCEPVSGR